jgi:CubicO group peptidase (beta-lactamase class C family)
MFRLLLLSLLFAFFAIANTKECSTRSSIENSLLDAHIPGAVMVVVNTTDILYQDAFGHQSLLPAQLMDVDKSIFVLASISKTFIVAAVMQLVESKHLDLDTDINQYLFASDPTISHPLYPTYSITLRQLLSHSASIGKNNEVEINFFQTDDKALTETTLTEACFSFLNNASNWLPYPPGTVTLYSNVGSALAALIVERVAKISYEQYIREKILKPLGIDVKKAAFRLSDIEDRENLVKHYTFNSSQPHDWNQMTPQLNITLVKVYLSFITL